MIRIIAGIVGLILVGSAAHGTILASGGYDHPAALVTIALALGVAVGAAAIGTAAGHGRLGLAVAIGLGLAAGEGYGLLSTSERVIVAREAAQAEMRNTQARHDAATKSLLEARDALKAMEAASGVSERQAKAQAAMDAAVAAIRDQASLPGCKENCRQLLTTQAADARRELDAAQADGAKSIKERRETAEKAVTDAEAAVAAAPLASSPTPLADRVGVQPWLLDIIAAVLLSLGVNGLGAALIALAAHGHARGPLQDLTVAKQAASNDNQAPEVTVGRVSRFIGEYIEPAESGRIEVADLYKAYRAWCQRGGMVAVDMMEFGDRLNEALDVVGIRIRAHKDKVYLVGVEVKAA